MDPPRRRRRSDPPPHLEFNEEQVEYLRYRARWNLRIAQIGGIIAILTAIACLAAFLMIDRANRALVASRSAAIVENCRNNQAQDNVLRAILRPSIESDDPVSEEEATRLRHTYERVLRKSPGNKSLRAMRLELVEHLMKPLGGFQTSTAEQQELCIDLLRKARLPVPSQSQP